MGKNNGKGSLLNLSLTGSPTLGKPFILPKLSQPLILPWTGIPKRQLNPSAHIWVAAYKGIQPMTFICCIQEALVWGANLHIDAQGEDDHIGRSRSRGMTTFYRRPPEQQDEVMLMVDNDIGWQAGDLAHLARTAIKYDSVVGGIYPKRAFGEGVPIRWKKDQETCEIGSDNVVEVTYISSGFMAIPCSWINKVAATLPTITEGKSGRTWLPFFGQITAETKWGLEFLSEDWSFCQRIAALGGKILVDLKPRLVHQGEYIYRLVDTAVHPPENKNVVLQMDDKYTETTVLPEGVPVP